MGNRIRHEYGDLDYVTLWTIREDELIQLRQACEQAIAKIKPAENPENGNGKPTPAPE